MAIEDLHLKACSEEAVLEVITKLYSRDVNIKKAGTSTEYDT